MTSRKKSLRSVAFIALFVVIGSSALLFKADGVSAQKGRFAGPDVREVKAEVAFDKNHAEFKAGPSSEAPVCAQKEEKSIFGPVARQQVATCPLVVLAGGAGQSGNERAPNTNFRFGRSVYLITAAELASAGYASGTPVTTVGWSYLAGGTAAASAPLIIYLENTADATNLKSTTWATAIAPMTTVHNGTVSMPSTATAFDVTLTGGSPFTYTGGGLYVAFDFGQYTGTLSAGALINCNTSLANGLLGNQSSVSAPTTLLASAFRPETRLSSVTQNDNAASILATYGEIPFGDASAHQIRATITNKGALTQTNVPVTLTVTGVDSFTNTQIIPTLASCGGTAVVTFPNFAHAGVGTDNIQISVPVDDIVVNNTLSKSINVTSNSYSYKIPGSTASGGVGLTAAGAMVAKFTNSAPNAVTDVKLEFNATSATTYKVAIYGDSGTGTPAASPIYVDAVDRTVTVAGPVTITLPAPVAIPAGNIYVGIQQTNATNAALSYDTESPIRTGSFFLAFALPFAPDAVWVDEAPNNAFKLNIGVIFQNAPTAAGASVSGRVTAGGRSASGVYVNLTDPSGVNRSVKTNTFGYYTFNDVPTGVNYVVSVTSKRYTFANSSQIISVSDNIAGVDFNGEFGE